MINEKRQRWVILAVVLFGFIGHSIAYPIFAPLFFHPDHRHFFSYPLDNHLRGFFFGLTLMMYPLGQFFGASIWGAFSDLYGCKRLLLISSASIIVCYLLTAYALLNHSLYGLIVVRFLTGCSEGKIAIARSMVVDLKSLDMHRSLGLINLMCALGYILGPLLGGVLSNTAWFPSFDFSTPFYASALCGVVLLILIAVACEQTNSYGHGLSVRCHPFQPFNLWSRLKTLAKNRVLMFLLITSSMTSLAYDALYAFYPTYLIHTFHADSMVIACCSAVLSVAVGIGCSLLSPWLARRVSGKQTIAYLLPVLLVLFLAFLTESSLMDFYCLFVLMGLTIGVLGTQYTVLVSFSADATRQGEVFGLMWSLRMLLDGMIAVVGGLVLLYWAALPILLASLVLLMAWIAFVAVMFRVGSPDLTYSAR